MSVFTIYIPGVCTSVHILMVFAICTPGDVIAHVRLQVHRWANPQESTETFHGEDLDAYVHLQVHWQATPLELTDSSLLRSWASLVGSAPTPWMQSATETL